MEAKSGKNPNKVYNSVDKAEHVVPPFDTTREVVVREVSIVDDVEILGHVFHGLQDIEKHVEMSLYKSYW